MRAGRTAAVAAAALVLYLFVYSHPDDGQKRRADHRYYNYFDRSHYFYSLFLRLKILSISNFPIFLSTINVTTAAITASQMNTVHHQLPTV